MTSCGSLCRYCTIISNFKSCGSCATNSHLISGSECGCDSGYFFSNNACHTNAIIYIIVAALISVVGIYLCYKKNKK